MRYFLFLFIPALSPEVERWLLKYLLGVNATLNILQANTSHAVHRYLSPAHPAQHLPHKNFLILC
jgi:hypothetical protein